MAIPLEISFVVEPSARYRSEKHRFRSDAEGIIHKHADVILISSKGSGIACSVRLLCVIVTELDEQILPCLEVSLNPIPDSESLHAFGAAAVLGIVCNDHIGI